VTKKTALGCPISDFTPKKNDPQRRAKAGLSKYQQQRLQSLERICPSIPVCRRLEDEGRNDEYFLSVIQFRISVEVTRRKSQKSGEGG